MCTVCGCAEGQVTVEGGKPQSHDHSHTHGDHHHHHDHADDGTHHYGHGAAHAHAPGLSQARMVQIETDILAKNNEYANANRRHFDEHGILALNLVSSPGSGKTTLLTETIKALSGELDMGVIEGDQQTAHDAERIRKTGAPAIQVNTGKGCHLDGHMVGHALEHLAMPDDSVLFIENVGNLVCPAGFDLGEAHKVVILSVTEGEDKPIKYPDMFHASDVMLLTKTDLLPHLDFDVEKCLDYARRVNPRIKTLLVSAKSGEGMQDWLGWIRAAREMAHLGRRQTETA
ncbi:hydrogenase nickel incorporation protein HypB [Alisedimentitalea sp. MJ-SS2]|uniref:hydrogenase nickel incorporation protein HypB n=1 Tax=Aliisedimentitalea sp. MJ-SS2 TaxID=3049795 RepID=UPI0029065A0E|nr:hydrogenase nickel incorporation protein HypB [Alisedimentitalea sp. MJ-SS2]MDU8929654.1 hydrogenase nickel incorporation protein HypB [Alisedimentitalea sp. MJ-SS2]